MVADRTAEEIQPEWLRAEVRGWIEAHADALARFHRPRKGPVAETLPEELELQRLLRDAGFLRLGWPREFGGLGGSMALRGAVYDEMFAADYALPESLEAVEIVGPALVRFAPAIARVHLPRALAGDELWAQGLSEPSAGSDLAGLTTRAVECPGGYRLRGQKVWTTLGQFGHFGVFLARTGAPESRHRGLTLFWLDLSTPGVTVRSIRAANGRDEFAEVFLDDAEVPRENIIGALDGGWAATMYLLQFERGMYAWMRQARLHARLSRAAEAVTERTDGLADAIGDAYLGVAALRAKARETVIRLAAGETPGPETSVDKVLLSTTEQAVFEVARRVTTPGFEIEDGDALEAWRAEWFYARACSIFGGAVEVQRDIIAEQLLGLPKGRAVGA